ncbi:cell envelope integrity/translocation protein TolA [Cypionkella aquatica]|uniref:Cell envelope integrity/translocation protein TolA n=1 Tax=Cypionkella aquatica TaxID=1756042 RepID=A0AA37U0T9_9RHOB|nr:cell envelope biogenesis protein TolA [Cypionkella aquatica]GLS85629.1 cell envelope integrity/translocation protein TolA [Cypionkella aquatica]
MDKSQILSGVGHVVVISWVVLGDWLFAPRELPPPDSVQVSMVSESDLAALQDAAAKSTKPPAEVPEVRPAAKPKPQVEAPAPVEPEVAAAEPPPVEPAQPEPVQPSPEIPVADDPQPDEAPPAVAPIAEQEQLVVVPDSTMKPKPRPSKRITDTPVEATVDTPVEGEVAPEVTDQPTDQPPVEEEKPAAAPQESAAQTAPDAVAEDAPELAPTSSRRPQTRPDKPVVEETPTEDPQVAIDAQAAKDAKEKADKQAKADAKAAKDAAAKAEAQAAADAQAAVEAALAEGATDAPAQDGGQTDIPEGPPMTAGEKEGLRVSINQCWNIGTLSTAAQRIKLTLRVEMKEDGTPDSNGITMTTFSGGDDAAAAQAFEAARRAVIRGVKGCGGKAGYDLDPAKYGEWNVMNLNFDASGMRLR